MFDWFRKRASAAERAISTTKNHSTLRDETSKCYGFHIHKFNVAFGDDNESVPVAFFFFQNDDGTRFYELEGSPEVIENLMRDKRLECMLECELWARTGIKPEWYEDIALMKLSKV